jgi:hypothetical protein
MNGLTVGKGRILACLTNQRVLGRERIDGGANSIVLRGRQVATAGPSARRGWRPRDSDSVREGSQAVRSVVAQSQV